MLDSSNSSLFDATKEWKDKAEDALRNSLANMSSILFQNNDFKQIDEISKDTENITLIANEKKIINDNIREKIENLVLDINGEAQKEIKSLNFYKDHQMKLFQTQIDGKNNDMESILVSRREEAARLRGMISHLTKEISIQRNNAKSEVDRIKRLENSSLRDIRIQRERLIHHVTELSNQLIRERLMFDRETKVFENSHQSTLLMTNNQLSKQEKKINSLLDKHNQKDDIYSKTLSDSYNKCKDMQSDLIEQKKQQKSIHNEILKCKKNRARARRRACLYKDNVAILSRQLEIIMKEKEELEETISRVNSGVVAFSINSFKVGP